MKKLLALSVFLLVGIVLLSTALAQHPHELSTDGSTVGNEAIVLNLTNNGNEAITVSGPIDVQVELQVDGNPPWAQLFWEREALDESKGDVILNGESAITIEPGQTAVIAEISPGLPDTWRPYDTANHEMNISAWMKVDGVDWHSNIITHTVTPVDDPGFALTLTTNSPTQPSPAEGYGPEDIVLRLTNNSRDPVTISGPVVVSGTRFWTNEVGNKRERFNLMGGQEQLNIPTGETRDIAVISAGMPGSWLGFYSPGIVSLKTWIQLEDGLWESGWVCHVVEGDTEPMTITDTWQSFVESTEDNEDGTNTITVKLFSFDYYGGYYANEDFDQCVDCNDCHECDYCGIWGEPTDTEPYEGLTRDQINIQVMGPEGVKEAVQPLSVLETEPGLYKLVFVYEEGTHDVRVEVKYDQVITVEEGAETGQVFAATISVQGKEVNTTLDPATNNYTGTLTFSNTSLTFTSAQELQGTQVSVRRKSTSVHEAPEGATSVGLFMDIELVSGDLTGVTIRIEVSYDRDDLPPGTKETDLKLFRYNEGEGQWLPLPNQGVDIQNQIVWAEVVGGFSQFSVFEYSGDDTSGEEPVENGAPTLPPTNSTHSWLLFAGLLLMLYGVLTSKQRTATE